VLPLTTPREIGAMADDKAPMTIGPTLVVPWTAGDDPGELLTREWLVTNGLGGYASGTVASVPTRRYHGMFVPNLPSPRGRTVMLARLDEEVRIGDTRLRLSGAMRPDGTLKGGAHEHLADFRSVWRTPVWRFALADRTLERRIVMPHGQNTVIVEYRLLDGGPIRLELRPYLTFRMHDGPLGVPPEWPFTATIVRGRLEVHAFDAAPALRLAVKPKRGVFVADDRWSGRMLYQLEQERGLDHIDDVSSPGYYSVDLRRGEAVALVTSTEPWETLEIDPVAMFDAEQRRLKRLLALAPPAAREGLAAHLVLAADQFVVLPGSRFEEEIRARAEGDEARTVIAGYHWFTDWGRDTMISLEGLTLATGRHREARAILRTFSHYVRNGLLPNLFPEGQRSGLYHTVDATLWYFHAIDRYLAMTADDDTLDLLFPVLESIVARHEGGTDFGIAMDPRDALIRAAAPGYQLTWMDAKVDDWVVTPRRGKPVEIQALWYNALSLMEEWAGALGKPASRYADLAAEARASFNQRFWYEAGGWLYDVVDTDEGDDPSLRPNQVFTMSLRFPVLDEPRWRPVLDVVHDRLLTPYGLRTLDPAHPDYHPRYEGVRRTRDAAYHQGLVWAWLIGHFVDAWRRVHGDAADARRFVTRFADHLTDAGIGTISEIFDAEPPFVARGCIAQAWSVAEVLRAMLTTTEDGSG
jgi:predicted glycogen debranching enzyme